MMEEVTAENMKTLSDYAMKQKNWEGLEEVLRGINDSASNGYLSYNHYEYLNDYVIRELRERGFSVEHYNGRNEDNYTIRWS